MIKDLKTIWKLGWVRQLILIEFLYIFNYFTCSIFLRCLISKFPAESVAFDKIVSPTVWLIATLFLLSNAFKAYMLANRYILTLVCIVASSIGISIDILLMSGYIHWILYLMQLITDLLFMILVRPIFMYMCNKYVTNISVDGDTMTIYEQTESVVQSLLAIVGGIIAFIFIKMIPDIDKLLVFNAKFDIFANVAWVIGWLLSFRVYLKLAKLI